MISVFWVVLSDIRFCTTINFEAFDELSIIRIPKCLKTQIWNLYAKNNCDFFIPPPPPYLPGKSVLYRNLWKIPKTFCLFFVVVLFATTAYCATKMQEFRGKRKKHVSLFRKSSCHAILNLLKVLVRSAHSCRLNKRASHRGVSWLSCYSSVFRLSKKPGRFCEI